MNRIQLVCDLLISYLKQNKIKHIVISSGTRAIPFIRAIENDEYFICHSVVDERNAAFYGLGISQQLNEPVALTCTSGTAASNYLSGMTEAFYAHTPLVAITADRSMQVLNQLETQKVDQPAIFIPVTQRSVCLPIIKDKDDLWYAKHLLDEAFIAVFQRGGGPIHINLPIEGTTNEITIKNQREQTKLFKQMEYFSQAYPSKWGKALDNLATYRKIIIIIGQNISIDEETKNQIRNFCHNKKVPVLGDNLSNFRGEEMIFSQKTIKGMNVDTFEKILPDLVISIGNNFQERIKDLLKAHQGKYDHWLVDEGGVIRDWTRSMTAIFESDILFFFEQFNYYSSATTDGEYLRKWKEIEAVAQLPQEMPWSNFYLAREFSKMIPDDSLLHLAILNSTRLMQFFKLPSNIKVTSNASSFGIDGCLPTLLGQAKAAPEKLAFLLIGDLSFFYGMNALCIRGISSNVRILISNNGGGAEFHIFPHTAKDKKIDIHIGAAHKFNAKQWALSAGFEYRRAVDKDSLDSTLKEFVNPISHKPIILEVFTDLHFDGEYCLEVYHQLEKQIKPIIEAI